MKFFIIPLMLAMTASAIDAVADSKAYPGLQVSPAFTATLSLGTTLTIPLEGGGLRISKYLLSFIFKKDLLPCWLL